MLVSTTTTVTVATSTCINLLHVATMQRSHVVAFLAPSNILLRYQLYTTSMKVSQGYIHTYVCIFLPVSISTSKLYANFSILLILLFRH